MRVGNDFYVGSTRFVLSKASSAYKFVLRRADGRLFDVADSRWTFIRSGVRVQAGTPRNPDGNILSVVVDAPRDIKVMRGALYRKPRCQVCHGSGVLVTREVCHQCGGGTNCSNCGGSGFVKVSSVCPECGGSK